MVLLQTIEAEGKVKGSIDGYDGGPVDFQDLWQLFEGMELV